MHLKKFCSLIFVLFLLLFTIQSCEKEQKKQLKTKSNLAEINRLIELGEKHFENVSYDSSYYYFNKAKSLCDVKKDTAKIIYTILNLATIEQNQGDYAASESTVLEALPFLKNNPKPNHHWGVYTTLAINYLQTYDYKLALYYDNLALNLKTNQWRKASIKNNIALINMEMQDYQKAIQILQPLILEEKIINDKEVFSIILNNLGYSYYKAGNPKGIRYLNQALKMRKKAKNDWGLTSSYVNLSEYYQKDNPRLSFTYALMAYDKSKTVNNVNDRLISLALLIQNSSGNQLKKFSLDYIRINDSVTKARQIAKNQFAKIKYDSKKEKEENLSLKTQKAQSFLQLEQQKNKNIILILLIIIGFLSTIFVYYFLKASNKKEKLQTSYDTEIRIAERLHDELANDVYHTLSFAETQDLSSNQNKEILLHNLDTIYSRTRNISKENSAVDTRLYFVAGLKEMITDFNSDAVNIMIYHMDSVNWNALAANKKIIVYRVLQELLINMKKHSKCSLAAIIFKKNENKLQIDYSDNGVGASLDKNNSTNGLINVENRILSIKGNITFDTKSGKGFKTSLSIPV